VAAVASNDVRVVGQQGSTTLTEGWKGRGWSIVSSPAFAGIDLSGISAAASTDGCAVEGVFDKGTAAVLHFNDTSWSSLASPGFPQGFSAPHAVTALSPTDVWLAWEVKVNNRCCPTGPSRLLRAAALTTTG
jgi:hypothetical protein